MEGSGVAKAVNESTEVNDHSNDKTEKGYERVEVAAKS